MRESLTHHRKSDRNDVARHRRAAERLWLPTRESLRRVVKSRTTLGVCVLACLGLAATAGDLGVASSGSLVPVTASSDGQMAGAAMAFAARPPDASVTATTVDPAAEERRRAEEAERE